MIVVKSNELFADQQNRNFVSEALQYWGELVVCRLKWRVEDFDAGLVTRCTECQATPNPTIPDSQVQSRLSQVYKQSGDWWCPACFGVGFTGGFKPVIYQLFTLVQDTSEKRKRDKYGRFWSENPEASFYAVPTLKDGDLIIRIEKWDLSTQTPLLPGERFELQTVAPQTLRTGPTNSITRGQQIYNQTWEILIGQTAILSNLPENHPFYSVEYTDPSIQTVNNELNPGFYPSL